MPLSQLHGKTPLSLCVCWVFSEFLGALGLGATGVDEHVGLMTSMNVRDTELMSCNAT